MQISVGQALLLLIAQYPDNFELKQLYMNGAVNNPSLEKIKTYLLDPMLDVFEILSSFESINNDPTRRYFETHLARHTLNNGLVDFSVSDLEAYYRNIQKYLSKNYIDEFKMPLDEVLSGKVHTSKFEYQRQMKNYFNEIEKVRNTSSSGRIFLLRQLLVRISAETNRPVQMNHVEKNYRQSLEKIKREIEETLAQNEMIGEVADEMSNKLFKKCKTNIEIFNKTLEKLKKDPGYENTGREFSHIIASVAKERGSLLHLKEKIELYLKANEADTLEVIKLIETKSSDLENNTVQHYLKPFLNKIRHLQQASPEKNRMAVKEFLEKIVNVLDDLKKMYILARCGYVSTLVAMNDPRTLLFDIYNTGYFESTKRGRYIKESSQSLTLSQNFGLLKSSMSTSIDDIAHANKPFHFMKPSEQSNYIEEAIWVKDNFSQLVHPFSNSISGTMLIMARMLLTLASQEKEIFPEKRQTYFKLFISMLLFHTGGHSLHEFLEPLNISEIKTALGNRMEMNVETMFYNNNKDAFDKALSETIKYNQTLMLRQQLLEQIRLGSIQLKSIHPQTRINASFAVMPPRRISIQDNIFLKSQPRLKRKKSQENLLEGSAKKRILTRQPLMEMNHSEINTRQRDASHQFKRYQKTMVPEDKTDVDKQDNPSLPRSGSKKSK